MVNTKKKEIIIEVPNVNVSEIDIPNEEVKWCSISLSEIINNDNRLEASTFSLEAKQAREILDTSKYPLKALYGDDSFFEYATNSCRFKRDYKEKNDDSVGFLGSSEILNIYPKAEKFISKEQAVSKGLLAKQDEILISCSGTIGNISLVSKSMRKHALSQHMIRAYTQDKFGYIYAFLKTKIGKTLIQTNTYGSVVQHIEPEHLKNIFIPNPPDILKQEIHNLIVKSYALRDESNDLIDEAEKLLIEELKLPPIEEFQPKYLDKTSEIRNFEVSLSKLNNRVDASYHLPIVNSLLTHLQKYSKEIINIGNRVLSDKIILAGVFKRTYVGENEGVPFLGGKDIMQLSPNVEKFLSRKVHEKLIKKSLEVKENMILITDRGTIGNVMIVPKHFEGWAVSQNVIKLVCSSNDIAGYIYSFLNSQYGEILLQKETYGSVINMIDDKNVAQIPIPLLKNENIQKKINDLVLLANKKRYKAYQLEQKAIKIVNEKVIYT